MASLSHLAAGAVCGAIHARVTRSEPAHAITAYALLALAPDLDFVPDQLGARGTPFEHRAMTHALSFAVVAGAGIGALWWVRTRRRSVALLSFVALASHGILDALTLSSPGPQLLWPFTAAPVSFPWQPIPGTDSFQQYFLSTGVPILQAEALLCIPLLVLMVLVLAWPNPLRLGWTVRSRRLGTPVPPDQLDSS